MMVKRRVVRSGSKDKRHRGDLDLFVLALVEAGVSTPYDLQRLVQLSQGATNPVLARLRLSKLVRAALPGPRGRTAYEVTAKGSKYVHETWPKVWAAGPTGDTDADLRVALLYLWFGGERSEAASFLKASKRPQTATDARTSRDGNSGDVPLLATWYTDLRANLAQSVDAAREKALDNIIKRLPLGLDSKTKSSLRP